MAEPKQQSGPSPTDSPKPEVKSAELDASKAKTDLPQTPEDKDFTEQLNKKTDDYIKKVQALRSRFDSQGSIGKKKADILTDRQVARIEGKATEKKTAFKQLLADQKKARMDAMLGEAVQDYEKIYYPYEKVIDYCRGLDKIDDAELAKIEAIMEALSNMKANPKMEALFMKVLSKQPLKKEDYLEIVGLLSPVDLNKEIEAGNHNKLFESTQMGAIIGVMTEAQRFELIDQFITTKGQAEGAQLLEVLLNSNILSTAQALALCESGKITDPQKTQLIAKINAGDIAKKQEAYKQDLQRMILVNQGRTAENAVNKSFGTPGLLALLTLHSLATLLVNIKANFDSKKPISSIVDGIANPYGAYGVIGTVAGVAGMAQIIDPVKYDKTKSAIFDSKDVKQAKAGEAEAKFKEEMEMPLKTNPYIGRFLTDQEPQPGGSKKSGFTILWEMATEQKKQGKPVSLKYAEILSKLGPKQQESLGKALGVEGSKEFLLEQKLTAFMACCFQEGIITDEKLTKYIADFNQRQGLQPKVA